MPDSAARFYADPYKPESTRFKERDALADRLEQIIKEYRHRDLARQFDEVDRTFPCHPCPRLPDGCQPDAYALVPLPDVDAPDEKPKAE